MADVQRLRMCRSKPRVLIASDIRNEPDDAESLVRYMLYSNEFDTRGLLACTSTHMRYTVHPEDMVTIIKAYGTVVDNLNAHVHPENAYSPPEHFLSMIRNGPNTYGKKALGDDVPLSEGSALIIERIDESEEPLWVLCWGGTNPLAQALWHIRKDRSAAEVERFCLKLRVYTISDQDDTGAWIRRTFPSIVYICSVHGWNEYGNATWFAISGEVIHEFDVGGPDRTKITRDWLKEHIQVGPLGSVYPNYPFLMEGDTPTFLYLIQNGLGSSEHPEWGSWGGRYTLAELDGPSKHYADACDDVLGNDGQRHRSNHATLWRWREHFQDSFAARMQWTLTADRSKANHAPVAIVNDSTPGPEPLLMDAEAGSEISLDASRSYDPDGDELVFKWFYYKDVTRAHAHVHWFVPDIEIRPVDKEGKIVKITLPPPEISAADKVTGKALAKGMLHHFILQITDKGSPPLTTYKRVVVQTTNDKLLGGSGKEYESVTASMRILEGPC